MGDSVPYIQSLPVRTPFYGTTDVERNLTSQTTRDSDGVFHSTLRGRQLIGKEVVMPEGYCVSVATFATPTTQGGGHPSEGAAGRAPCAFATQPRDGVQPRVVQLNRTDNSYLLWEHDQLPNATDAVSQWVALAHALHA